MAVIDELLRSESNGNISFGNHGLAIGPGYFCSQFL